MPTSALAFDEYAMMSANPAFWAEQNALVLDGRTFSFKDHEYQIKPMCDKAPEQCSRKGAQIGWSSIKMLKSVHGLIHGRYPNGVLYFFPTKGDVTDFSKGRFRPLIESNYCISQHVTDTDASNIKKVGKSFLYFRGMKSRSQAKSVPSDRIVFDEIDEMDPVMIDLAMERISHSSVREVEYISTPSIPDYGIDLRWQRSDQRLWMIRCQHCGTMTCLEKEFEDSGWDKQTVIIKQGDRYIRACKNKRCQREIYPKHGEWVPTYPERSSHMVGWWVSQLNSMFVDPTRIMESFQDTRRNISETYNSKIGLPHVDAENRLSIQAILDICSGYDMASEDTGPCSMGVDQGKHLHVVIGKRSPVKSGKLIHMGVYKDWGDLSDLMKRFRVGRCVVDAMPETRNARDFAESHPGRVYLSYYNERQRGSYSWDEQRMVVSSNRTESMDASHRELSDGLISLPRCSEVVEEFARHCHSVAKRLEEDDETGSRRYVYLKLAADHFRHAFNYECMARHSLMESAFGHCDMS